MEFIGSTDSSSIPGAGQPIQGNGKDSPINQNQSIIFPQYPFNGPSQSSNAVSDQPKAAVQDHAELFKEKDRIAMRLHGFDPKDNPAWKQITQRFGANIKQSELLSIAEVLANSASIKLDRDAKRRKSVLIKWFQEHWQAIYPFLGYVVLEDSHQQ